jgi:phosphatidate phosphatase LPIN
VDLFDEIHKQGYKILYLSARSILQSDSTRRVIQNLSQNNKKMPNGPVLLNPVTLMNAFHMELIEKCSDKFKSDCLKKVKELFGVNVDNPFHAGFGNTPRDILCYDRVGIRSGHVFIINPMGDINVYDKSNTKLSYKILIEEIERFFPRVKS